MALALYDRVKETSTTTGTGNFTLAGAATGYQSFNSTVGASNQTYYCIERIGEWEVGLGTLIDSTTLQRDSVLASSNSNSLVNFSAGQKNVFLTLPASVIVYTGGSYSDPAWITSLAGSKVTGNISGNAGGLTSTLAVTSGGTGTATQFTAGSVVFAGASGIYAQDNSNLFWDDTNNRLGIGTTSPQSPLHVYPVQTFEGANYSVICLGASTSSYGVIAARISAGGFITLKPDASLATGRGVAQFFANQSFFGTSSSTFSIGSAVLSTGYGVFEAYDCKGMVLSSYSSLGDTTGILFSPNRSQKMQLDTAGTLTISGAAAGTKKLIIKGSASETANLLELQNSSGTTLTSFSNLGHLGIGSGGGTSGYYRVAINGTSGIGGCYYSDGGLGGAAYVAVGAASSTYIYGGSITMFCSADAYSHFSIGTSGSVTYFYLDGTGTLSWANGASTGDTYLGRNSGASGGLTASVTDASFKVLTLKGAASQSANLVELQNSSSTALLTMGIGAGTSGQIYTYSTNSGQPAIKIDRSSTSITGSCLELQTAGSSVATWGFQAANNNVYLATLNNNALIFNAHSSQILSLAGTNHQWVSGYLGGAYPNYLQWSSPSLSHFLFTTTTNQELWRITGAWSDNTDATRTGRLTLSTLYTSTAQEGLRIQSASDQARVAVGGAIISGVRTSIYTGVATDKGLVVQGAASQSANLLELQNSSGTAYVTVGPPTLSGSSTTSNFFNVTGTLPSTLSDTCKAVNFQITTAGSSAQQINGLNLNLLPGYTGSSETYGMAVVNSVVGTAASYSIGTANIGGYFLATASTTGHNVGLKGYAYFGDVNVGVFGRAVAAKNSATNMGVIGLGRNTGTSPIQVGGYFGLNATAPTLTSAALMCDNSDQTSDIFVARDNGTAVFTIADGGTTTIANIAAGTKKLIIKGSASESARLLEFQNSSGTAYSYFDCNQALKVQGAANDGTVSLKVYSSGAAGAPFAIYNAGGTLQIYADDSGNWNIGGSTQVQIQTGMTRYNNTTSGYGTATYVHDMAYAGASSLVVTNTHGNAYATSSTNGVTFRVDGGVFRVTSKTTSAVPLTVNPAPTLTVTNKALTSNVATLTVSQSQNQYHGLIAGDSVTVAGVDATFNGTYTLTATTYNTVSYAKTAGDVASTSSSGTVTPTITGNLANFTDPAGTPLSWFTKDGYLSIGSGATPQGPLHIWATETLEGATSMSVLRLGSSTTTYGYIGKWSSGGVPGIVIKPAKGSGTPAGSAVIYAPYDYLGTSDTALVLFAATPASGYSVLWAYDAVGLVFSTYSGTSTYGDIIFRPRETERARFTYQGTLQLSGAASGVKKLVIKGAASESANLIELQNSSGTALASFNSDCSVLTMPSGFAIGAGTHTVSTGSVLLGDNASGYSYGIAIGYGAVAGTYTTGNITIGKSASSQYSYDIAIGESASINSGYGTAIGAFTNGGSYANSIALGAYAAVSEAASCTINTALNTSGAATVINLQGQSSTSARPIARLATAWGVSTDATRTGRLTLSTYYTSTAQEAIRIDSASDQARVAVGGAIISGVRTSIYTGVATDKGLVIQGASSQSANLLELQNSSGTAYVTVGPPTLPADSSNSFLNVAGTLNASASSGTQKGVNFAITPANVNLPQYAVQIQVPKGGGSYSNYKCGLTIDSQFAGTGAGGVSANAANYGIYSTQYSSAGTISGDCVGVGAYADGSTSLNAGVIGHARVGNATNTNAVGVIGTALITDAGTKYLGGYFSLSASVPTFASAALMCDNGTATSNIFVARDNGTAVFTIADGGTATIANIAAGTKKLIIKGSASETANLFELQNSSSTVLLSYGMSLYDPFGGSRSGIDFGSNAGLFSTSNGTIDFTVSTGVGLRVIKASVIGTNDLFFQAVVGASAYGVFEGYGGSGTAVSSVSGNPIIITPSRTTVATFTTSALTLADGINIAVNTSTGTKIGTSTSQKLGFFNATPVVQPSSTTDLRTALINLGLYASGGASPLDLNGGALTGYSASTNAQTGTTYTLAASDLGKVVTLSNASAITLTLPNSLSAGFVCTIVQKGAGQVTFSAASGATLRNRQSQTKTAGQYAVCTLYVDSNSGGSAADYYLAGDTGV